MENTKQLNAPLNCSPHGPCAIPPRHGQSQLNSPVSSLKAPSCEDSSSVEAGDGSAVAAVVGDEVGPSCEDSFSVEARDGSAVADVVGDGVGHSGRDEAVLVSLSFCRLEGVTDSRVWSEVSSEGPLGGGIETGSGSISESLLGKGWRTWRFFSKQCAGVVVIDGPDCQAPSCGAAFPTT